MRSAPLRLSLYCAAMILSATAASFSQAAGVDHVVIIGVDGLSNDGLILAKPPVMMRMMAEGASTYRNRSVRPTSSSSNWASIMNGAGVEQHGVTSNDWLVDNHTIEPTVRSAEGMFPSIFGILRAQRPAAVIAAVYEWAEWGRLIERKALDVDVPGRATRATAAEAVRILKEKKPTLLFVHFDNVDGAGHGGGHGSPDYYKAVLLADSLIGTILQAEREAGIADRTVTIVVSDHGGIGYGHGGDSMEELENPRIFAGKGIARGRELTVPVATYDLAPTVAAILGLRIPEYWIGRPTTAIFADGANPAVVAPFNKNFYARMAPTEGLFPASGVDVALFAGSDDIVFRYTTDSSEPTAASPAAGTSIRVRHTGVLKVKGFSSAGTTKTLTGMYRMLDTAKSAPCVRYAYYEGAWQAIPDFSSLTPMRTGTTYEFSLRNIPQRDDGWGIRFEGSLAVDSTGSYRFGLNSDDGSKLYVDGKLLIDNDGSHGAILKTGDKVLSAGIHSLRLDYFEDAGGSALTLYYEGPGTPRQEIPYFKLVGRSE